jgi:hypothetical protein
MSTRQWPDVAYLVRKDNQCEEQEAIEHVFHYTMAAALTNQLKVRAVGIVLKSTPDTAYENKDMLNQLLRKLGWMVNPSGSVMALERAFSSGKCSCVAHMACVSGSMLVAKHAQESHHVLP